MHSDHPWITDHLPGGLVLIAAINGIAEHAFYGRLVGDVEELLTRDVFELKHPFVQILEHALLVGGSQAVEFFPVFVLAVLIHGGDAGTEELCRSQRKLVALAGRALRPRSLLIEPVAFAPCAGKLAINKGCEAEVGAGWSQFIGRYED